MRELTIDEIEINSRFGIYKSGFVTRDELADVVEGHGVWVRQGSKPTLRCRGLVLPLLGQIVLPSPVPSMTY